MATKSEDMAKAKLAIKEQLDGPCKEEGSGAIDCPTCGKGMAFVRLPDGRVHAACSTQNCLNWADPEGGAS